MIVALDSREKELRHPKDRRGKKRNYYAYAPYFRALKKKSMVDMLVDLFTFRPNTKQTHTKEHRAITAHRNYRQTDAERYEEILRHQRQNLDK